MGFDETQSGIGLAGWSKLAHLGGTNAISGLSQMINEEIQITALELEEISMRNATNLVGKTDDLVLGIYLMFSGSATGQIMLAFQPHTAYELVDMAMGMPSGSTHHLGEMEQSVLAEMGNIVGAFFLNAVADNAELRLLPSPPVVKMDTAGAMIGPVVSEALSKNPSLFAIRLIFSTANQEIEGRFLVLPDFDSEASPQKGP